MNNQLFAAQAQICGNLWNYQAQVCGWNVYDACCSWYVEEKIVVMFADIRTNFFNLCREQDARIYQLGEENVMLRQKIVRFENKIDDNEAYERKDTVNISGKRTPRI